MNNHFKNVLTILSVFLIGLLILTACGTDDEAEQEKENDTNQTEIAQGGDEECNENVENDTVEKASNKNEADNLGKEGDENRKSEDCLQQELKENGADNDSDSEMDEATKKSDDGQKTVASSNTDSKKTTTPKESTSSKNNSSTSKDKPQQKKNATSSKDDTNTSKPKKEDPKPKQKKEEKPKPKQEPKPDQKPNKPSGYDSALTSKVNGSTQRNVYNGSKASLYSSLVKKMASGEISSSSAKSQVSGEFKEGGMTYYPRDIQAYTFTSSSGGPDEILSTMQNKGIPASTEYRQISVYYNANSNEYTIAVLGLGFDKMESF